MRDRSADAPTGPAATAGVLLAAGTGSRMGRNKLLLEVEGEPLVRRVARRALDAGLGPVIVVVGFEADRVVAALDGLAVETVRNAAFARGVAGSLRRGVARVPARCDAAVVLLADMPFVTSAMIARVVALRRESGAPLVVSRYGEAQAPPTLYARALFGELTGRDDGAQDAAPGPGKRVVRRHRAEAVRAEWPADALADIDEPSDYDAFGRRLTGASS